jgi:hypothetical protein
LRQVQQRDDGGLLVVGGVAAQHQLHALVVLLREVEVRGLLVVRGVLVLQWRYRLVSE